MCVDGLGWAGRGEYKTEIEVECEIEDGTSIGQSSERAGGGGGGSGRRPGQEPRGLGNDTRRRAETSERVKQGDGWRRGWLGLATTVCSTRLLSSSRGVAGVGDDGDGGGRSHVLSGRASATMRARAGGNKDWRGGGEEQMEETEI
ncbi:hypothetical protein SISSUDRAFT_354995 [Sistotremastrum suecicum HHB10207 ss-3]|uniref:Uncharacterized protein n=1 Tax=Sistotremastrum suecicum HHB10207 ss-3 TaxID=1314776 RepID=A0A166G4P8_9AGAM|nr:hypothetical protein SISSUDRAFT_354995 [Sistotremastrum suecicum HHB10207 ss-3]